MIGICDKYWTFLYGLFCLFIIEITPSFICNTFKFWHIKIWTNNGAGRYNWNFFIFVLSPIPIRRWFHTTEVIISDCRFTCLTYLPVSGHVLLWHTSVINIFQNLISNFCGIWFMYSTIFTIMHQLCHIFTDAIKEKVMNIIKVLMLCIFNGELDDVIGVEGA